MVEERSTKHAADCEKCAVYRERLRVMETERKEFIARLQLVRDFRNAELVERRALYREMSEAASEINVRGSLRERVRALKLEHSEALRTIAELRVEIEFLRGGRDD